MPQCCYFNLPPQVGLPSPSITVVLSPQAGDSASDPPLGLDFAAPTREGAVSGLCSPSHPWCSPDDGLNAPDSAEAKRRILCNKVTFALV